MFLQCSLPKSDSALAASCIHPTEIRSMSSVKRELNVPLFVEPKHTGERVAVRNKVSIRN